MREIVNIQLGHCGNTIGNQFWETICYEHGIDRSGAFVGNSRIQLDRISVYFSETRGLVYAPRSVMIDLDRSSMDSIKSSPYGRIFKPNNFIFGKEGTGNNWAKGHFTEGTPLCDASLEIIRREVENCDCFHGFQIIHSIGGGTGGGLGSLLIGKLYTEYSDRLINTYSIFPSPKVGDSVVEPYNAMLSINHLIEHSHQTFCMDNEAIYDVVSNVLKLRQPNYNHLNCLISMVMAGITSGFRFPGPITADFRKIAVNLIPYPRLHFFVTGYAPIFCGPPLRKVNVQEITAQLFNYKNMFAACDIRKGMFLTVACVFRGPVSTRDVDRQMYNIQNKNSPQFVEWIPNNVRAAISCVPPVGVNVAATFIGNTTAIQDVFKRIRNQYLAMFKKKAFLHWYTGEGMDESEFKAAETNVNDLIAEYKENEAKKVESQESSTKGESSIDVNASKESSLEEKPTKVNNKPNPVPSTKKDSKPTNEANTKEKKSKETKPAPPKK